MTSHTPSELQAWMRDPPVCPRAIRLPDQMANEAPVGQGFEVEMPCIWSDPDTAAEMIWTERRLVLQNATHAQAQ